MWQRNSEAPRSGWVYVSPLRFWIWYPVQSENSAEYNFIFKVRSGKPMLYEVGSLVAQKGNRESIHSGCHE